MFNHSQPESTDRLKREIKMTYVEILRAAIKEGKTNRIEAVRWLVLNGMFRSKAWELMA
jgi:hypothetical protein